MNITPKKGESLEGKVTLTITQRDILLLKLCLGLVDQEYVVGRTLRFDIRNLQDRLSDEPGGMGGTGSWNKGCSEM